ncbi:UNVERIFIED_CONTAM: Retrovirus-related Pol polyprotein from transposon RE1 [Sesamum radiatum]|uniref:Retrovirus-related Pol polyprotein from transposon RE1 n=1 Tax=Sesamum radiatum TaxID=300843 RepID=A0AAW2UDT7_SESRA
MTTEGGNIVAARSVGRREPELPDFLQLHVGDNPGMFLVSAPFDGFDFLAWKRSVVIALRANMKLGFIDGWYTMPDETADTYETWIRVDSMVTSWILNAISKRISKAFLYTKSSRQLWLDLEEQYGENNGPLVYKLQRDISSISQGTMNVVEYFNNLSALWDEFEYLMPTRICTCGLCACGSTKLAVEDSNLIKLVRFLMGLNDSYDGIRNQILVMNPFPSINKAYAMVLRVERQRLVNMQVTDSNKGNSMDSLIAVKRYLDDLFTIKDLGHAKYFLGLELARSPHGTYVRQRKYLLDIVRDCQLDNATPASTPLPVGIKFDTTSSSILASPDRYRRLVGRLLYLGFSRPDISFAVQQLSQFIQHPRQPHWEAALHLVRYLKGTPTLGFFFGFRSSPQLTAYSDSDWALCLDTRHSVTGYCIFLDDSLVSRKTKKHATVSRSSAEAEYRSMGSTVCELLWLSYILGEFDVPVLSPIPFCCDNKAAIHITENSVFHERTKHLDIDCHLVRDHFKKGFILPRHIPSQHQVADLFTKALPAAPFTRLFSKLGMLSHAPT